MNTSSLVKHIKPIKEPQNSHQFFCKNIAVWGEVEKDGKAVGARQQAYAHKYTFALWVVRNVKKHIMLSVTDSKWKWYSMKLEPSHYQMCHHRTQHPEHSSAPTASKQSSQTKAAGLEYSSKSHHPNPSHNPPTSSQPSLCPGQLLKGQCAPFGRDESACSDTMQNHCRGNVAPAALPEGMGMFVCSGADHLEELRRGRETCEGKEMICIS